MGTSRQSIKGQKRIQTRATRRAGKQELSLHVAEAIEERIEEAHQLSDHMLMLRGINPVTLGSYTFEEYSKMVDMLELESELTPEEREIKGSTFWAIDYYADLAKDLAAMDDAWFQDFVSPADAAA